MPHRHILHIAFSLCFSAIIGAMQSQAEEPNELTRLRSNYNGAKERAVKPINARYEAELKRLKAKYTGASDLKAALAVDAELQRLDKMLGANEPRAVVSSVDPSVKADIAPLRRNETYGNNRGYKIARVPSELAGLSFLRMEVYGDGNYEVSFSGQSTAYLLVVTSPSTPIDGKELEKAGWKKMPHQITTNGNGKMWVFARKVQDETIQVKSKGEWAYMIASAFPIKIDSKQ